MITEEKARDGKYTRRIGKMTVGCIFFFISFLLLFAAKRVTGAADWYMEHIYPLLVAVVGRFFGIFPFSVAEICLYLLAGYIVLSLIIAVVLTVRKKNGREQFAGWFKNLFLAASVLFLLYVVNCGINYERMSFSYRTQMKTRAYTSEKLTQVCRWLTDEVNQAAEHTERDSQGLMVLEGNEKKDAVRAMESLGKVYTVLGGYYPQPKWLMNPWILSVQNLSGIYLPFTIEANYNHAMTDYNIPFTMCHELSHLKGFMQEEEANYIAWLACTMSDKADFQYSGKLMGWIYCMNVLHKVDYESYQEIRQQLSPAIEPDLKANSEFWARYKGKIAEVSNRMNDTYLKANGQEDGVKSYDRMVDLIVAYYDSK